jgi:hypothetical protein
MGIADKTIFALWASNKRNTRKLHQRKKKLQNCETKKCPTNQSRLLRLKKIYDKEMADKCTQKDATGYYNCSEKVYNLSKYKKAKDEHRACKEKKCLKEYEAIIQGI